MVAQGLNPIPPKTACFTAFPALGVSGYPRTAPGIAYVPTLIDT